MCVRLCVHEIMDERLDEMSLERNKKKPKMLKTAIK